LWKPILLGLQGRFQVGLYHEPFLRKPDGRLQNRFQRQGSILLQHLLDSSRASWDGNGAVPVADPRRLVHAEGRLSCTVDPDEGPIS
jgi:hypothetical protein